MERDTDEELALAEELRSKSRNEVHQLAATYALQRRVWVL